MSKTSSRRLRKPLMYLALLVIMIITLGPFIYLIYSSFQFTYDLASSTPSLTPPSGKLTLSNYEGIALGGSAAGMAGNFLMALVNSLTVVIVAVSIVIFTGSLAAYAFSRLSFRWKDRLFVGSLASRFIPPIVILIPVFVMFRSAGLVGNLYALAIFYSSYQLPYIIWILTGYFKAVPKELDESGMVDGCSRLGTFFRIVLPCSITGLAVVSIYAIIEVWNEFIFALALTTAHTRTVQVQLGIYSGYYFMDIGAIAAGAVSGVMPMVIFALFFQKYIIKGLTEGALKF